MKLSIYESNVWQEVLSRSSDQHSAMVLMKMKWKVLYKMEFVIEKLIYMPFWLYESLPFHNYIEVVWYQTIFRSDSTGHSTALLLST